MGWRGCWAGEAAIAGPREAGLAQVLGHVARKGEAELGCGEEMGQRKETGRKQGREGRK